MKKLLALALVSTAAVGCADDPPTDTQEILPGLNVPPVPANGLQVITPIFRDVAPGTEVEVCTWTDAVLPDGADVRSTIGYQTDFGHHTIVYYTTQKLPAGTQRVCTDNDMASFRYLAGNPGDGIANVAPGNLVYKIPPGAQIVINHHYLNAGTEAVDGQSVVNLEFADPGQTYTPSGSTAFLDSTIQVPPGVSAFETTCNVDRTLKLWYFAPHMHRWGTRIQIDHTHAATTERLFDTAWQESFTFHPPELRWEPDAPKMFVPGDQLKVRCEWNNDTAGPLGFGFEMCVAFGMFVDDTGTGNFACDGGSWTDF
ncbi:MAG: hypothetical protein JNK64_41310 [Myxococcales bacterium]|nr:hypothetical protein [Myxococcales bacterium]